MQGGNPGSGADLCQPDLQLFPGHAPVLLSVPGPVAGLHPPASDRTPDPVHASARPDSRCPIVGGFVSAVCYSVRRRCRALKTPGQSDGWITRQIHFVFCLQDGLLPGQRADLHSGADESDFRLDRTSPDRSSARVAACYRCFLPRHL